MKRHIDDNIEVIVTEEKAPTTAITLADVLARLWVRKYILIIWIAVGVAIGVVIASGTPREYQSMLRMVPESIKPSGGASMALAALGMGTDLNTEDAYNPSLYPDIVSSIPFVVNLLDVEVQTSTSDTTYTLRDYLEFHTSEPWWSNIFSGFSRKDDEQLRKSPDEIIDPFRLTKAETDLCNYVAGCIWTNVDKRSAEVSIVVTMQDPLVAAQLTDTVGARLQEYIIDYRTAKARNDLDYAITINEEAQRQYYEAQQAYAEYMDRNQGLALYSAQTTRDRLENEMQLAFNLYNQTSQQVQQCEAKVQESTPAFAIVEPSTVAIRPVRPRKMLIVGGWTIAFTLAGMIVISLPLFVSHRFSNRLREEEEMMRRKREKRSENGSWLTRFFHRRKGTLSDESYPFSDDYGDEVETSDDSDIYYSDDESRFAPPDANKGKQKSADDKE